MFNSIRATVFFALLGLALPAAAETDAKAYWPRWRGPAATGVAPRGNPPVEWSENKNVRWKLPLPGKGHSTPVIWGDRLFVTSAEPYGQPVEVEHVHVDGEHDNVPATLRHRFIVLAVHRRTGEILWRRIVREELPKEGGHVTGSLASNSPVTDGERVYAFFGSRGLHCLDVDGRPVWEADLGHMRTKHAHGEGSSPALHGDLLIVNWDHEGDSFLYAFDKRSGKTRWKAARDEGTSWSTPIVVDVGGQLQVIVSATKRVRGYELATGALIWECGGLSRNVVASPVTAGGILYACSSYDFQAMVAIQLAGAKGDIGGSDQVLWSMNRRTSYVPSPLLYGDWLYLVRHNQAFLSCLHAKTGEVRRDTVRLQGLNNIFSSPVGVADRVYITDLSGATLVLSHGLDLQRLALNRLEDHFAASAAIAEDELYLRGERNLYCIADDEAGGQ